MALENGSQLQAIPPAAAGPGDAAPGSHTEAALRPLRPSLPALAGPAALLAGVGLAAAAAPGHGGPQEPAWVEGPVWVEREAWVMGTRLNARVAAPDREAALAATELVFAEVRRLDALLSSWRDDSELARLNEAPPGRQLRVARELAELLLEAEGLTRRTSGAFDPGVGALVDAWDLRGEGRRPAEQELRAALAAAGMRHFKVRLDGAAVRLTPGAWVDTGAFGKGAALRSAREALHLAGVEAAVLDFGGQILALGPGEAAEPEPMTWSPADRAARPAPGAWEIAVAHPARRAEPAARLRLRDASAATTSASERFVTADGERLGHVLDPRSGRPAPAWGSVTVVSDDPLLADALSTALFVLGPQEGAAWARAEGVAALFLYRSAGGLSAAWSPTMAPLLVAPPGAVPAPRERRP